MPKTRTEWWKEKLQGTSQRDLIALEALKQLGWQAITIWECVLISKKRILTLENLYTTIKEESILKK